MTSAWRAVTDCQIVVFSDNLMRLYDDEGETLVTARRPALGEPWTISGGKGDPISADDRPAALEAMKTRAHETLGHAISTLVPFGLADTP